MSPPFTNLSSRFVKHGLSPRFPGPVQSGPIQSNPSFTTCLLISPSGKKQRSEDYTGMQRGQTWFFTYYRFLALRRHCSVGFRKMVNFCTVHGKKASFLGGHELLCVHCVSKQPLILIPEGLPCDELECREVHVYS
jgi:hypothetical protein